MTVAPPQPPAMPATPAEALAEIERLERDPDFSRAYRTRNDEVAHAAAVERMTALYKTAHGEAPAGQSQPWTAATAALFGEPDQPGQQTSKEEQALAVARAAVEQRLGANFESRVESARNWLGPELVAALEDVGVGNDPAAIHELVFLAEDDRDGLMRATAHELLSRGVYHSAARLERTRREADASFMRAYLDGSHPEHATAKATMKALHLLEHPPAFMVRALERLSTR